MSDMLDLIRELAPLRLAPVSPDMSICRDILRAHLPFTVWPFLSGAQHNGWIVPDSWSVASARITNADGHLMHDGTAHPLGVAMYSDSFSGTVTGKELKKHCFFSPMHPHALVYHCDWLYKPHQRSWGFSIPGRVFNLIDDDARYTVHLDTSHKPGIMESLTFTIHGTSNRHYAFNAHNCHPTLCNDDLSGIAVGVELFKRISEKKPRHTYTLVIAPEHFGTIFLLQEPSTIFRKIHAACFLEAFGTQGKFALQRSFHGDSIIDTAILNVLSNDGNPFDDKPFREVAGNDETVWEAPGIEIPCASLTRYPFPEYHTSLDCLNLMDAHQLDSALSVMTRVVDILERDVCPRWTAPDGLVCLSNPAYDLYQPFWDPSISDRRTIDDNALKLNRLMNHLPRLMDGTTSCLDLAMRFGLPFPVVRNYIDQFSKKGLLSDYQRQSESDYWA